MNTQARIAARKARRRRMAGYILRRLWQMVPTLAGVVLLIFLLFKLFGGDPAQGWSDSFWKNLFTYAPLPILLAALVGLAPQTRLYRSFFLDETKSDYVRTARAKGLSEPAILRKHVLRNALVPVVTNISLLIPGVFVGSFLLEIFFSIPGLGREIYLAVNRSDYPVIQAVTIYLAVLTMLINLAADVLYSFVDPRIQLR